MSVRRRALLLAALAAAGFAVGLLGYGATASGWWLLAVPIAVAAGWLFVADPTRCDGPACPPPGAEDARDRADHERP